MAIYTYVVDHGDDSPRIDAGTIINGGKIQGVMFDDGLLRLEEAEEKIEELQRKLDDNGIY